MQIPQILEKQKQLGKIIVFTNGCFDILHTGHLRYLTAARKLGDILVVGLNSDESVRRLKGKDRPVNPETDRQELLLGLKPVDYVIIFSENDPCNLIACLKPDIHVKGGDYSSEKLPEYKIVSGYGGRVIILPFHEGKSTTGIINRMKKNHP